MKKYIVNLIFILSLGYTYAQSMFDKYEDNDAVTSVIVTEDMFQLLKDIEPESAEAQEEIDVVSKLTGLKIFVTENQNIGNQIKTDANDYIQNNKMTELMRINDKDVKVKFYIVKGDQPHKAKELIMIETKKNKTVVMLITGDIDLKKLSKLNGKIKIIDGKYLEKVEEKEQEK